MNKKRNTTKFMDLLIPVMIHDKAELERFGIVLASMIQDSHPFISSVKSLSW